MRQMPNIQPYFPGNHFKSKEERIYKLETWASAHDLLSAFQSWI